MTARIFQREKNPMQSGKSYCGAWRLVFEPQSPKTTEPLMGWTSTRDTQSQVTLDFPTREQAVCYAEKSGTAYEILEPAPLVRVSKAYGDNFRQDRKFPWSH